MKPCIHHVATHYSQHPKYTEESYQEFMEILLNKWNLPQEFIDKADLYFLRHWTAADIAVSLSDLGIRLFGTTFLPKFNKGAKNIYERELLNPTGKMFWLSFRSIHYPVDSQVIIDGRSGTLRSYVIIQAEDKK